MKDRPIEVVYAIAALVPGGAERQLLYLLRELPRDEFSPRVLAFDSGPWEERFRAMDIPIHIIPYRIGKPRVVLETWRYLRQTRPDLVHLMGLTANYLGRAGAILARVPRIVIGERSAGFLKTRSQVLADRLMGPMTDGLIANSYHGARYYVDEGLLESRKVHTVLNGIDMRAVEGNPRIVNRLGNIGDLRDIKNHRLLIDAVAKVSRRRPDISLAIAGEGELRPCMEEQIKVLGIGDNVSLSGYVDDIPGFLAGVGIYVHTAHYEGLPNAIIEAMNSGLPCIITDTAGSNELVRHQQTGLVVPHGDADALCEAILTLVDDPAEAHRMGRAAREFVERELSIGRMVTGNLEVYRSLF